MSPWLPFMFVTPAERQGILGWQIYAACALLLSVVATIWIAALVIRAIRRIIKNSKKL
jgi:hypothetical protein